MPVVFLDVQELSRKWRLCPPRAHRSLGGVEPLTPVVKPLTPGVDFHDHSPLYQLVIRHKIQWYRDSVWRRLLYTFSFTSPAAPTFRGTAHLGRGQTPGSRSVSPSKSDTLDISFGLSQPPVIYTEGVCPGLPWSLEIQKCLSWWQRMTAFQERCMAVGEATAFSNRLSEIISSLATFFFFPEEEKSNSAPSKLKTHSIFFFLFMCINFLSPSLIYPSNYWEFFGKARYKSS